MNIRILKKSSLMLTQAAGDIITECKNSVDDSMIVVVDWSLKTTKSLSQQVVISVTFQSVTIRENVLHITK